MSEHEHDCPRLQAWDHGEYQAPCTCVRDVSKNQQYPGKYTDTIVYEVDETVDFTREDWLNLALACLDQAQSERPDILLTGATRAIQSKIEEERDECSTK